MSWNLSSLVFFSQSEENWFAFVFDWDDDSHGGINDLFLACNIPHHEPDFMLILMSEYFAEREGMNGGNIMLVNYVTGVYHHWDVIWRDDIPFIHIRLQELFSLDTPPIYRIQDGNPQSALTFLSHSGFNVDVSLGDESTTLNLTHRVFGGKLEVIVENDDFWMAQEWFEKITDVFVEFMHSIRKAGLIYTEWVTNGD